MDNPLKFSKKSPSIYALVIANLFPLLGVIFFSWSLFSIILIYWLETMVIGFYNVLRIAKASGPTPSLLKVPKLGGSRDENIPASKASKLYIITIFLSIYGTITLTCGWIIILLFSHLLYVSSPGSSSIAFMFSFSWLEIPLWAIAVNFILLFISHGISYITNFIGKEEYKKISPAEQLYSPTFRLLVLIVVIFGSIPILDIINYTQLTGKIIGQAIMAAVVLGKIILDILFHIREHSNLNKKSIQIQS